MPQHFSEMSDEELMSLARRAGILPPEEEKGLGQRIAEPIEKVAGPASLAGLVGTGLRFVPHPYAQGAGRVLQGVGALGSAGFVGAGGARVAGGEPVAGGIEAALGLLGMGGMGAGSLSSRIRQSMQQTFGTAPKVGKTLPPLPKPSAPSPVTPTSPAELDLSKALDDLLLRPKAPAGRAPSLPLQPKQPAPPRPKFTLSKQEKLLAKEREAQMRAEMPNATGAVVREITRTKTELDRLRNSMKSLAKGVGGDDLAGLTDKQLKAAELALGERFGVGLQMAKTGRPHTSKQLHRAINKALNQVGMASTELATRIFLASAGGAAGVGAGDTTLEKVGLGLGGAYAGFALPSIAPAFRKDPYKAIENMTFFSLLSHPAALAKANLGAVGGAITKASEMTLSGLMQAMSGNPAGLQQIVNAAKIYKSVVTVAPKIYVQAMRDPRVAQRLLTDIRGKIVPGKVPTDAIGVGRILSAGDAAGVAAMKAGGVSVEEAMRYTLSGTPTSKTGAQFVDWVTGKPMGFKGGQPQQITKLGKAAAQQVTPFPRTNIQMLERGVMERTPGIAQAASLIPGVRKAVSPGASGTDLLARQAVGALSAAGGAAGEEEIPTQLQPIIAAALGPNAVPYAIGWAAERARRGGKFPLSGLGQPFEDVLPLGREPLAILNPKSFPREVSSRVVPGIVAAVAQALDPAFQRKTGPEELHEAGYGPIGAFAAPTIARIPKARETLPETPRPVDVFGRPTIPEEIYGLPGPASRFLAPSLAGLPLPPAQPQSDPRLRMLRETGIERRPPDDALELGGFEFKNLPRETKARLQRNRGMSLELALNLISQDPTIAKLPPGPIKKRIIEQIIEEVQREMAEFATVSAVAGGANVQR